MGGSPETLSLVVHLILVVAATHPPVGVHAQKGTSNMMIVGYICVLMEDLNGIEQGSGPGAIKASDGRGSRLLGNTMASALIVSCQSSLVDKHKHKALLWE